MAGPGEHPVTYYGVRLPHFVLIHGEQLRRHAHKEGGFNQTEMWKIVNVNEKHVGQAVTRLRQDGYLAPGRPLRLGPETGVVLGISLGRESLRAAIVDANGTIRASAEAKPVERRMKHQSPAQTIDDIAELANRTLEAALDRVEDPSGEEPLHVDREIDGQEVRALPLIGVAVAWPMGIHRYTKEPSGGKPTIDSLNDGWWGKHLPGLVAERLGLDPGRVHAVNDANAAAVANVFDRIRDFVEPAVRPVPGNPARARYPPTSVLMTVRVGGGIGAGTMTVGAYDRHWFSAFNTAALIETESGLAGEIGHLPIAKEVVAKVNEHRGTLPALDPEAPCSCGGTGHLEALASVTALVQRLAGLTPDVLSELGLSRDSSRGQASIMQGVIARIERGHKHPTVERALKDIGLLVGHALAGPVLMSAPSAIRLVGAGACEPVIEGLKDGLNDAGGFFGEQRIDIACATGANNTYSSARGAALFVFREVVYRHLDEFQRLYDRAKGRKLAPHERVFAKDMHAIVRDDLPLGQPVEALR